MASVAIVGVMAGIAIPNYMKFSAKARQKEAQVALTSVYVSEKAYATEVSAYTACLWDIGYRPVQAETRYYSIGFTNAAATQSTCGSNGTTSCSLAGGINCTNPMGSLSGGEAVTTYGNAFSANAIGNAALGYPTNASFPAVGAGVSNFSAGAVGNIYSGATRFDTWGINGNKQIYNPQSGL